MTYEAQTVKEEKAVGTPQAQTCLMSMQGLTRNILDRLQMEIHKGL